MKLLPYARFFFNADDGGGGGGGGAAVVDAPSTDTPPSAEAVLSELGDFEAPNPEAFLNDAPPEKPEEKPPVEKPEKPEEKRDEPKPPDTKPEKEPPAKQLRERLAQVEKERDEFRSKFENHPRVKELETSIAEREKELESLKTETEKARRELEIRDPFASAKLREHVEKFDQEYQRGIEMLPELDGSYQQLVAEFANLPRGTEQYRAALSEFETKLEEAVGQRKFAGALEFIRKGADFAREHSQLQREVTENASKLAYESREAEWKKQDSEVSSLLATAFDVPEDLEETDPYNPAIFVKKALSVADEGKQKEIVSTIDKFVKNVFAGPKPRTEKDFPGLSPKEIQEKIATEGKLHGESRQAAVRMMKQGMLALTMLRPIMADYAKLKERVAALGEEVPPNPNNGGDAPAVESDDLSTYTAPAIRI